MRFVDAGRLTFEAGLKLQEIQVERCLATGEEVVFLLEHEPVYTIGRTLDKSSLGPAALLPYPTFEINRGGQATYHGPGQLVAYPILDLRVRGRDLHLYLRNLEGVLIDFLAAFGIATSGVVLSTVLQAADLDYRIIVVGDCCADLDPPLHTTLVDKIFPRVGTVTSTADIVRALGG